MYFNATSKARLDSPYKSGLQSDRVESWSGAYLYKHGPLRLHDHLQQRFDQSLRCGWNQVEKVNDGRADLHLLEKE